AASNRAPPPPAVHADRDRAERDRGPEGHDPLRRVRAEDRHAIALAHAMALRERTRHLGHELSMLPVREAPGPGAVAEDEVLRVAERRAAIQEGAQIG